MNTIKIVIAIIMIGTIIFLVNYNKQTGIKTKTELIKGNEEREYIKGEEEIRSKKLELKKKIKTRIDNTGIAKEEIKYDDSSMIKVEVKVERDSVEIQFDLTYFEKSFMRVDTIRINSVDTMKIEMEKIIVEGNGFWEKWWFGAGVVIVIWLLLKGV